MTTPPRIAVALDRYYGWHEGFCEALRRAAGADHAVAYELVDLDRHDWVSAVAEFDAILCKSPVMGRDAAAHFKEKVYFLETHLGKLVFPNFKTVWHYDSKVAQSYILAHAQIPTPHTVASFECHDAEQCLQDSKLPLVFKGSAGAGSEQVWLVRTRDAALAHIQKTFAYQLWREGIGSSGRAARLLASARMAGRSWMRTRIMDRLLDRELYRPVYWQEFIDGNDADLRITVIGGRYACAFWRRNRPNDFRASGSGLVDYARPIPEEALRLCFEFCRKMDYDSMAFDLLVKDGIFAIIEMSYLYVAAAIAGAPGVYERTDDGRIEFVSGGREPQDLWVAALLAKLPKQRARPS